MTRWKQKRTARPEPLDELLAGEVRWLVRHPDGSMDAEGNAPPVLLPGSFNPLHTGHREMMEAAGQATGQPRAFELSVTNVDKPPLEKAEILRRLAHFGPVDTVVLTRAETFQKKAALFPRNVFLLGWDTAIRLVAPRYYGGEAEMMLALSEIMAGGTKFPGGRAIRQRRIPNTVRREHPRWVRPDVHRDCRGRVPLRHFLYRTAAGW